MLSSKLSTFICSLLLCCQLESIRHLEWKMKKARSPWAAAAVDAAAVDAAAVDAAAAAAAAAAALPRA